MKLNITSIDKVLKNQEVEITPTKFQPVTFADGKLQFY